jgi:DNA replication protein DnaC
MDLLIIDEIGYVPSSEKGAQLFFQVAARAMSGNRSS